MSNKRNKLSPVVGDNEFLYRGIVPVNWDREKNRPSSAAFKDSKGVSVDRDGGRDKDECVETLLHPRFMAIARVKTQSVKETGAIVKYLPTEDNVYHSEIHDSETRVKMTSKASKIRDKSEVVFLSDL